MKSQASSQEQTSLNAQSIMASLEQELKLPIYVNQQVVSILKKHQQLKQKYEKQQKLVQFKDKVLENVVCMFQTKQAKILTRLKALEEINLKYMQRYLEAKKKGSKSRNLNMSLLIESVDKGKVSKNNQKGLNMSYENVNRSQQRGVNQSHQISMKSNEDSVDLSMVQMTESIFNSQQWQEMIRQSQERFIEMDKEQGRQFGQNSERSTFPALDLARVLIKCIDGYCYEMNQRESGQVSMYRRQIQELIHGKKLQVQENRSLKGNIQLNSDLKRLKSLLDKAANFEDQIRQLKKLMEGSIESMDQKTARQLILSLLEEKVEIEKIIEAETSSVGKIHETEANERDPIGDGRIKEFKRCKQRQKQVFRQMCQQIMVELQDQSKDHLMKKLIESISQKNSSAQSSLEAKLTSLEQYVTKLQHDSSQQLSIISSLKEQKQQIAKNLTELQLMKDKYDFYISKINSSKGSQQQGQSQPKPSRISLKLDEMISKQQHQKEKELLRECLSKKDELIQMQQHQISTAKQNLTKVQAKIKSYFKQHNIPYNDQSDTINLLQLFQNYSQTLLRNAYDRYPEQRQQMAKLLETKYQKMVQLQREEFQERFDQDKEELKHMELQRDSYKNSMNAQQKQFNKLKQFTQKLLVKKADLDMQNSKTQQILKNTLDMMFAYLMSNISYQSLLEQIQAMIENIKVCLKYREREKQRESKESPVIDYRFSGLSAVSNDYSFSKLNKESYCDYFNEDSDIQQESEVISKISSEDEVLPPSRPSFSTNNAQKRQMGLIDINQRATMAHDDESLLGYLNPVQIRTPRVEFQRNTVFLQSGLHDENIRTLQANLGYLKNRIPEQTVEIERQSEPDAKEMYIKYKQALKCLEQAQMINQDSQVKYQNFMKELKEEGVFEAQEKTQNKLFYMNKIIKEQEQLIEQQRIEFETTIAKKVMESQETMNLLMKNLNKSMSASRVAK